MPRRLRHRHLALGHPRLLREGGRGAADPPGRRLPGLPPRQRADPGDRDSGPHPRAGRGELHAAHAPAQGHQRVVHERGQARAADPAGRASAYQRCRHGRHLDPAAPDRRGRLGRPGRGGGRGPRRQHGKAVSAQADAHKLSGAAGPEALHPRGARAAPLLHGLRLAAAPDRHGSGLEPPEQRHRAHREGRGRPRLPAQRGGDPLTAEERRGHLRGARRRSFEVSAASSTGIERADPSIRATARGSRLTHS
mmetsp:Transcript_23803/g.62722  ORF Transcript_23803/g.62722 Transcript_23803/m.62722 type:complete len:251 (+) Transcript_23803:619-1371(+)